MKGKEVTLFASALLDLESAIATKKDICLLVAVVLQRLDLALIELLLQLHLQMAHWFVQEDGLWVVDSADCLFALNTHVLLRRCEYVFNLLYFHNLWLGFVGLYSEVV